MTPLYLEGCQCNYCIKERIKLGHQPLEISKLFADMENKFLKIQQYHEIHLTAIRDEIVRISARLDEIQKWQTKFMTARINSK